MPSRYIFHNVYVPKALRPILKFYVLYLFLLLLYLSRILSAAYMTDGG